MKKNIIGYILSTAFMALAAVSCSFLDVDPETQMTDEGFYESPNDIRSVLYSTYASLRDNGLYNTSIWTVADVRSDVAFPSATRYSANMYKHESEEFNITSNNTATQNFWSHSYRAIKRANTVIIKGQELFPDDADVQLYIVEAKVLRALFYFNLVRVFGDVPIVLDIPDSYSDAGDDVRMSVELVYEQILKDLTDAVNSGLMQGKNATPTGRVNLYAAEALLGKVFLNIPDEITARAYPNVPAYSDISNSPKLFAYFPELTATKWEAAKYYLDDVVNNGGYSLMGTFSDLFKPANKNNIESIWEVEFKGDQTESMGSSFYTQFCPPNYRPRETPNSNGYTPAGLANTGGGSCVPTGYFIDLARKWDSFYPDWTYAPTYFDGNIYTDKRISDGAWTTDNNGNPLPVNENKDYPQSVTYPYDPYSGTTFRLTVKGFGQDEKWFCGKYQSGTPYKANDSDDNWYIIRYADVLLMLAEAEARINDGYLSQDALDRTINMVRNRAGIIPYRATGASDCGAVLDTPEKVYDAIFEERTLELAFEGHRWFDLVRSGEAVSVMNEHFTRYYEAYTSNSGASVDSYYMKNKRVVIDEYCTLFPIPSKELLLNPRLTQNNNAR
ncbi:MAG: RagB/SusD family nutrient uptake outer membrane protein [Bacteroidetes bacterium]|uniref:RagB/SusD family nutrient uptake outer membrane protein n=1 Tax=Candidatus Cryptobacteroides merdigallinarum TaxID=2840770 RepID=A0A9D9HFR7_9BACT|nr:RagB/SusD family nutrient uptake outer membrane protein [Candidatus Cryptobacteroides merdigallinarum]